MVHENDGEQRWSRLVLAWASALGFALVLALLGEQQIGLEAPPLTDSVVVVGLAQGVLCMALAGLIAPRRIALATLPVLPLVAMGMPVAAVGTTWLLWRRMDGHYSLSHLLNVSLPPSTYLGAASVAAAGLLAVALLRMLRTPRQRVVMGVVSVALVTGLAGSAELYYRALRDRCTRDLQPMVESFLAKDVLQAPGPIEWLPLVWAGHFPHPRFVLSGHTAPRADGSVARVSLLWLPSTSRSLFDVDFSEGTGAWRDRSKPQFIVSVSNLSQSGTSLTPRDLVRLGWIRPSLGAEFMAHPTPRGAYTAEPAAYAAQCQGRGAGATIIFSGLYHEGAEE